MRHAEKTYRGEDWTVCDVSKNRSYDLHCSKDTDQLHVEVKGTTGGGDSVILTAGEVNFAKAHPKQMELYVLSDIDLSGKKDHRKPSGGTARRMKSWQPVQGLKPTQYRYTLPARKV